jgi:hypothetical protein
VIVVVLVTIVGALLVGGVLSVLMTWAGNNSVLRNAALACLGVLLIALTLLALAVFGARF